MVHIRFGVHSTFLKLFFHCAVDMNWKDVPSSALSLRFLVFFSKTCCGAVAVIANIVLIIGVVI